MALQLILSQKNKYLLAHDGMLYSKKSVNKSNVTWRCIEVNCNLLIHTDSNKKTGNIVGVVPQHELPGNMARIQCKIIKGKIKKRAKKTDEKPANIVARSMCGILSPVAALLPKPVSLVRSVQRHREKGKPKIVEPLARGKLELPDIFKNTHCGELFLFHDNGGGKKRFLMFTTVKNLNFLTTCNQWLSDGTFKSVPKIFSQLYTIHGYKQGKSLPLVYVLAPSKSKSIYLNFLKVLKTSVPNFAPDRIMVDFEEAFIAAFKECFSTTRVSGCNFHYGQCIWRHVQSCGLQTMYNNDVKFAVNIRLLMALAFVPSDDVIFAYEEIVESDFYERHSDILEDFLMYYESTWIGKVCHNKKRHRKPLFDIELWNCYQSVKDDDIRSNNLMEGWHHGFNARISVCHASLDSFINALKDEQTNTETLIAQLNSGLNVAVNRRQAYRNYNDRLKTVVNNYDSNNKLQYLKNIAKLLI